MTSNRKAGLPIIGKPRGGIFQSLEITAALIAIALAATARAEIPDVALADFATGFDRPVFITPSVAMKDRYYVVEQPGVIRAASAGSKGAVVLNIIDRVNYGGEKGLLGLALHPNFEKNHRFFVNYTTGDDKKETKEKTLRTRISEFRMSGDFLTCDPASEKIILEFGQPHANHNGGGINFGPDGFLYIGNGDGGSGNDPHGNGQNLNVLLGKFLRIDVDKKEGGKLYAIPSDNPFAGKPDQRGEIWAYGMRNPWRWSFDRKTGAMWAGDVGQNQFEEVDLIEKGKNYGWRIMEGFHCTPGIGQGPCDQTGLTLPVIEYPRKQGDKFLGNSITGGYVYRGAKIPALQGAYIYGDFGSKLIWGLHYENGKVTEHREIATCPHQISSFGEDTDGELFVVGHGGTIARIVAK